MRVGEVMTSYVLTTSSSDTLEHAAQLMVERRVGSAVVVDDGSLAGIITERDVLRAVARGLVPWNTPVAECMTANPVTVDSVTPASEAMTLMSEKGFRHLPVIEDDRLVGIVSLRDLASQGVAV